MVSAVAGSANTEPVLTKKKTNKKSAADASAAKSLKEANKKSDAEWAKILNDLESIDDTWDAIDAAAAEKAAAAAEKAAAVAAEEAEAAHLKNMEDDLKEINEATAGWELEDALQKRLALERTAASPTTKT